MNPLLDLQCKSYIMQYTDADVETILAQYNRKPETVHEDVQVIRKWLTQQPHITTQPTDRQILYCLLKNKFFIEKTKIKIDLNYTIKSLMPEFFVYGPTHPEIAKAFKANVYCALPKLTKNLERVYIWKCLDCKALDIVKLMTIGTLCLELRRFLDFSNGEIYIGDYAHANITLFTKMGLMDLKKMIVLLEKVYSSRVSGWHAVNLPPQGEAFVSLFKSLLKPKMRKRVFIHKNYESLYKYISKEILPKDYGGCEKSVQELGDDMQKAFTEYNDVLVEIQKTKVEENLRPTKLDGDEILGYHGNFRQLQVD